MIERIEISPTSKATCFYCKKKIGKGTPRGVRTENKGRYYASYYYCYKCVLLKFEKEKERINYLKKELKKLVKKQTKEIIIMELENENNK